MTKLRSYNRKRRPGNGLVTRLLLPLNCLVCQQEGDWLCPDCSRNLPMTRPITCVICAKAGTAGLCEHCRTDTGLEGVISLFPYHSPAIQQLVRTAKFGGQFDALRYFVWRYGAALLKNLPGPNAVLTPIPLSGERKRQRGFNQAQIITDELAAKANGLVWLGLKRTRHTAAQAELGAAARHKNVRNAFRVIEKPVPAEIVLVDDVVTTGATLSQAARVLKKAGARQIWALTIAHG